MAQITINTSSSYESCMKMSLEALVNYYDSLVEEFKQQGKGGGTQ